MLPPHGKMIKYIIMAAGADSQVVTKNCVFQVFKFKEQGNAANTFD